MSNLTHAIASLESALATPIGSSFQIDNQPDVIAQLLADKRSPNTRRAYRRDIIDFFQVVASSEPTRDIVLEFLHLQQHQAVRLVLSYKAKLIDKGLSEATVNRRLAAIKALAAMGRKLGVCTYGLDDVKGEKVRAYRDTSGVDKATMARVIAIPQQLKEAALSAKKKAKGIRDYALLRLMWGNALRRGEISATNISDFDSEAGSLAILGKGQGTQKELVKLPTSTVKAIQDWLDVRGTASLNAPLFIALDGANYGHRLTGNGIYTIVDALFKKAGVSKKMSPHRIRHSSITAALDATDGNIRKTQQLSRHANINTVMTYDDNRTNHQGEMSQLLDDLL